MTDQPALIAERDGAWMTLWLNRPDRRNALSSDLVRDLMQALTSVREDRGLRGITLRGKGGTFCAGGDLRGFREMTGGNLSLEQVSQVSAEAGRLFHMVETQPQVVVVLVEGAAMAGGLGLACAGDVVAVTRDAKFALTETMIGIPPAQIAPYVVRRIGLRDARRIMLTGARFDGAEAERIGIADRAVADAAGLDAFEAEIRAGVLRCAPGANAATKEILLAAQRLDHEAMLSFAGERFARCLLGEEGREGVASFLEKRKPAWADPR
ncbi:enoyl-CoA hydratase/isomerase family protein [Antarcticimicrobium luteum]|uniref:Enoyl-CoA hydratase/isomerase family protein n=1 Tax=Antarcticimicrobium luteum TaxID=2547397 RepID=A0A4R5V7U0_9RHOB|nr:enoyl-CoA hydratase-related protein [Antarcticimicrobium luteum]TDK48122.1 enoyl-CoA hydratase/isomerase family protein [Antarcticimicrobium luteum]